MKSITTTLLLALVLGGVYAQDSTYQFKDTELGVRMANFNDFGFIYKKGKSSEKYLRVRASALSFNYIGSSGQIGLQTAIGKEKRSLIGERLQFIKGPELGLALSFFSEGTFAYSTPNGFFSGGTDIEVSGGESNLFFAPSIGYVLGFQYEINDKFLLSLETIPSLQFILFSGMESPIINLGFNTQAVAITVVYKFSKLKKK